MGLADELEKLAQLRRGGMLSAAEFDKAKAKLLTTSGMPGLVGVRRRSDTLIAGVPLWAIATGPDPAKGEMRGHAKGIIAVGDMATGVLAIGGLARGVVALGGLAVGLISAGGLSIGLALAIGGAAVGSVAFGGAAAGAVAIGGGALGHYALGGGAGGTHVISATRCDTPALEFFRLYAKWVPGADDALNRNAGRICGGSAGAR
jgi:hypothetical protein